MKNINLYYFNKRILTFIALSSFVLHLAFVAINSVRSVEAAPVTSTFQVSTGANDVNQVNTTLDSSNSTMWIGTGGSASASYAGLRFSNISIPQNALVTSAKIEFHSTKSQWLSMGYQIAADDVANSAAFSTSSLPSSRVLTTATVNHTSNVQWQANTWYPSNDISAVVQEVVNRGDWAVGNNMSFVLRGTVGTWGRKTISGYEANPTLAPKLVVTYEVATPTPTATPTNTPEPTETPTPTATAAPTDTPSPIPTPTPITAISMAVVSDSSSDEYRANDNRADGTQWEDTTLAWTELLEKYRDFDLGAWGNRSEPRRSGYEYNWARSGAEADDVINTGQHIGAAGQAQSGLVNVVYFQIGNNDFAYYRDGADIYSGALSGTALQDKLNNYVADVTEALDTLLASSPTLKVVFGNVADPGLSPYWQSQFPDSAKRQLVTDALNQVNAQISALATSRSNVVFFDQEEFAAGLLSSVDEEGNLVVGGEEITLMDNCDDPHCVTLNDDIHGGTVIEGLFANAVIQKINTALGTSVPLFSDAEILANAGIVQSTPTPTPSPTPTLTPSPTPTPTVTPSPTPTPKTIRITSNPNNTTQSYVIFDGITENGTVTTEVTSSRFTYSTGWTAMANQGRDNSPFRFATTANRTVTFTTSASSLSVMTLRHAQTGSFDVHVNNVFQFTYNTNSPTMSFVDVNIPL